MTQYDKIALELAIERDNAGYTQADVAKYLGVTYQAVSNWERSHTKIDSVSLLKLLLLFKTNIYDFMERCGFTVMTRVDGSDFDLSPDAREVADAYSLLDTVEQKNMMRRSLGLPELPTDGKENEALSRDVG